MTREAEFIALMRGIASTGPAHGLDDDVALLEIGGVRLVLTKDMIAESVHYRADDPPEDVAWKLVAVNLSDLATKGATPVGVMLGFSLGDAEWDRAFAAGLAEAVKAFDVPLLGGDTIKLPAGAPRVLSLTALGTAARADGPWRFGGDAGDDIWVSGTIGDAGAGLAMLNGEVPADPVLIERYRRPTPRLALGRKLAPIVHAITDVSDGLLIDAGHMATRRGLHIDLDHIPLSPGFIAAYGDDEAAWRRAATAGDDYELLFSAPAARADAICAAADEAGVRVTRIGAFDADEGLSVKVGGLAVARPDRLGYEHD